MGFIYALTSPSGKTYIGQTIRSIKKRFKQHQGKNSGCRGISGAIQKYGWKNFVIDYYEVPDEELNKHERWLVNLMGTLSPEGYNLREGGGSRGKASEESKQKNREARLGKKTSKETKQRQREARLGKKDSEETKQKKREAQLGKKESEETRQKSEKHNLEESRAKNTNKRIEKQIVAINIPVLKEYINMIWMAHL